MIPNKLLSTSWKENRVTYRPLDKFVAKQTRKAENARLDTVGPQRFLWTAPQCSLNAAEEA